MLGGTQWKRPVMCFIISSTNKRAFYRQREQFYRIVHGSGLNSLGIAASRMNSYRNCRDITLWIILYAKRVWESENKIKLKPLNAIKRFAAFRSSIWALSLFRFCALQISTSFVWKWIINSGATSNRPVPLNYSCNSWHASGEFSSLTKLCLCAANKAIVYPCSQPNGKKPLNKQKVEDDADFRLKMSLNELGIGTKRKIPLRWYANIVSANITTFFNEFGFFFGMRSSLLR